MANYTFLTIIAYGDDIDLKQFDSHPPKIDGITFEFNKNLRSRCLTTSFESRNTHLLTQAALEQIKNLSLLVEIEIEPGFCSLLHKEKDQHELQTLLEIPDYRSDDFFEKLHPDYLNNFDKPKLTPELIRILSNTTTGKTFLDLLLHPESYK
jgi:hypothetical protein